jgi:hypothetical protein
MSQKLDTLVDNYLELQDQHVFQNDVDKSNREMYVNATKKVIKDEIYNEVKNEVREAAVIEAGHIIDEKAGLKRIDEFKKLMLDGFIVAIFVGLFVNQVTDFIGFYKGNVSLSSIWATVLLALVFLIICIGIFVCRFISELIKLIKKGKDDEGNCR